MNEYIPPDPAIAEKVRQSRLESNEQYRRLEHESPERLREVLLNTKETHIARGNALMFLLLHKDQETLLILPDLFEDPDLGHMAIKHCHSENPNAAAKLRSLLDSPDQNTRADAALRLAMAKDDAVWPYLLEWFHHGDQGHRNVATFGLTKLDAREALELFRQSWETGDRKDSMEDRLVLAERLLSLGDKRGASLLEAVGREAKGAWSNFAAFTLLNHDPVLACTLMLHIIDDGDAEAKGSLVSQVWNIEHNPNAFNAEGIHEARQWVERQLQEHAAGRQVGLPSCVSGEAGSAE